MPTSPHTGDPCVLVTGGAGFIGSHTVVELLGEGRRVVVVDDLSNASPRVFDRIRQVAGDEAFARLSFVEADVADRAALESVFEANEVEGVIHFAGLKAVGESVTKPLEYYANNIGSTLVLCDVMRAHGCKSIIFSSSATVYGDPDELPLTEESPKKPATNPYGWTKWMIEQILSDLHTADPAWNVVLLRYFNPIGAHESGLIGEDPKGIPNNLLPYVAQVAVGKLKCVGVFGDDYPTPDGTGVRDYIHVVDLARGHVAALDWMGGKVGTGEAIGIGSIAGEPAEDGSRRGVGIFNLGTGKGSSVLDVIHAFEKACGHELPYEIKPRRAGDVAENYAACDKARTELGWVAEYDLERMCADSWRWQSMNPDGYATASE